MQQHFDLIHVATHRCSQSINNVDIPIEGSQMKHRISIIFLVVDILGGEFDEQFNGSAYKNKLDITAAQTRSPRDVCALLAL